MNFTKVYVITYILDKNTSADKDISFPSIFIHIYNKCTLHVSKTNIMYHDKQRNFHNLPLN